MTRLIPSREQQDVLDLGLDSIRIRAGAGTGKTTTVAMVIANLVENHDVDPESILGITFTNKAAAELADRVKERLGGVVEEGRQVEIHTYHGFAAQILAEFGALASVDNRVRIITPTFSRQVLAEIFHNSEYQYLDITYSGNVDRIRVLGDRLADHLLGPSSVAAPAGTLDEIWEKRMEMLAALHHYEREKRRLGVVDYGDLITLATTILQTHPGLASQVRNRYQAVILDEYQDTNPAQRVLLTTIFGGGFPVVAVGDEDQTIYEWRGATPENFDLFPQHFPALDGRDAHERGLTLNRRSAQSILDIANLIRAEANPGAELLRTADPGMVGKVVTRWATDAIDEAAWIAGRFRALHDGGMAWSEMAVLFRKNRDFAVVVDAMRRADIPVEVANLGGLLSVPEVADLRAWLTIIDRPTDSTSLIQILFGSRYRLGLADVAPLTRWVGEAKNVEDLEDMPGISLLEALEDLGSIEGLRPDARGAYEHFMGCYRAILVEAQGMSLVETCRLILDHTRAWQDVEALPPTQRLTARLNIYRLLDLAEDWSPLAGRPSLTAFLSYLDAMEDEPAEELDSARLSGEDAVTLVTVHRAKGLEWRVVALPAVTDKNFPSASGQFPDPVRFAEHLPAEYRIDGALTAMPADDAARKDFFREQNRRQEWRVAYVAATRAKEVLLVSGAYWYGLPEPNRKPKTPSPLFQLVASQPGVEDAGIAPLSERPGLLRHDDLTGSPDPLFAGGWEGALRDALAGGKMVDEVAHDLGLEKQMADEVQQLRDTLFAFDREEKTTPAPYREISVTGLVTYAGCPKRYFWSDIDPLPRRRSPAAAAGTELHRRIELFHRGQVPFEELEPDLYDAPGEGSPGGFKAFEQSRFATSRPALVEAPFSLALENKHRIRGRIDAVYVDGSDWEIVDFKSGRPSDDEARTVQLQAYAIAAQEADLGPPAPARTTVTFAYLGGGLVEESHIADEPWLESARRRLLQLTEGIEDGFFDEHPGPRCNGCDFLRFCGPGQAWLAP